MFVDDHVYTPDIKIRCGQLKEAISSKDCGDLFKFETNASEADVKNAILILEDLFGDPNFLHTNEGRFNRDSVNSAIALHVLGVDDVVTWMKTFDDFVDYFIGDWVHIVEKYECIDHYLKTWGPLGNRGMALDKLVE